jgi:ligand-binding SRPBCC domain-containing protein
VCFVDRQIVGPYRWWRHEHRFEAVAGGTRVIDHVDYAPRAGWLSRALVRRDLGRIFDYRQEALRGIFRGTQQQRIAVANEPGVGGLHRVPKVFTNLL